MRPFWYNRSPFKVSRRRNGGVGNASRWLIKAMMRAKKPTRKWYHFSVRTLLLVTLVLCAALAWLGVEMRSARRRQVAVEALNLSYITPARGPHWLRSILGDDIFREVHGVGLDGRRLSDSQWDHLEDLTTIRVLYLRTADVCDTDLTHFRQLNDLEELHLTNTDVTDAGLVHLRGLTRLRTLDVSWTAVTERGACELQELLPGCDVKFDNHTHDDGFDDLIALIGPAVALQGVVWEEE